ncbi:DUF659 domain-containing protein [Mycena venus]|uniref:DUF659 domain-containing protein n=1 Tax=Mycena venus TaxID=2733690 RepID=A0A8H6ZB42_9AGAR|nr:DUF659 domain-containing protein [Mycena venus]
MPFCSSETDAIQAQALRAIVSTNSAFQLFEDPEMPTLFGMMRSAAPAIMPWGKVVGNRLLNEAANTVEERLSAILTGQNLDSVADGWKSLIKDSITEFALISITSPIPLIMGISGLMGFADLRIAYGLTIATNPVLITLITGRIMWTRRAASFADLDKTLREHYTRAMGMVLKSGAIYCIGVIAVIATINDRTAYNIEWGALGQLMNIIPMFSPAYVGLKNTGDRSPTHSTCQTSSNQDSNSRVSV